MNLNINLKALQSVSMQAGHFLKQNSPTILTGLTAGGVLTTLVMGVAGGRKAVGLELEEIQKREKDSVIEGYGPKVPPLTVKETIQLTWKCYIPAVSMGLATIGCAVMANNINLRRNAALAGLYSLAETGLREYQAKVVETLGEKKEQKIREEILQDRLNNDPVTDKQVIITGNGDVLCYDSLSGRYFDSSIESIRKVVNDFNQYLHHDMYRTLNDLYYDLGLEGTDMGKNMGWSTDYGLLAIDFSPKIAKNGKPCIVLDFRLGPRKL